MRFGKFIDGCIEYAPNPIHTDEGDVFTNDPSGFGYLPIEDSSPDSEPGFVDVSSWEERDGKIIKIWTKQPVEMPVSELDEIRQMIAETQDALVELAEIMTEA